VVQFITVSGSGVAVQFSCGQKVEKKNQNIQKKKKHTGDSNSQPSFSAHTKSSIEFLDDKQRLGEADNQNLHNSSLTFDCAHTAFRCGI
jgi:hypothetical protein